MLATRALEPIPVRGSSSGISLVSGVFGVSGTFGVSGVSGVFGTSGVFGFSGVPGVVSQSSFKPSILMIVPTLLLILELSFMAPQTLLILMIEPTFLDMSTSLRTLLTSWPLPSILEVQRQAIRRCHRDILLPR